MLEGFELINKPGKTVRLCYRFEGQDEIRITEQEFIDKMKVTVRMSEILKHTDREIEVLEKKVMESTLSDRVKQENISEIRTQKFKEERQGIMKNRLIAQVKIEKGKKEFELHIESITKFLRDSYVN